MDPYEQPLVWFSRLLPACELSHDFVNRPWQDDDLIADGKV
jgi:hypothetical protein